MNHIKPITTAEGLGKLNPSFATMGQMGFEAIALRKYPESRCSSNHVHHAGIPQALSMVRRWF